MSVQEKFKCNPRDVSTPSNPKNRRRSHPSQSACSDWRLVEQNTDLTMRCAGMLDDDARIGGHPPPSKTTLEAELSPGSWLKYAICKGLCIPWVGVVMWLSQPPCLPYKRRRSSEWMLVEMPRERCAVQRVDGGNRGAANFEEGLESIYKRV